MSQTRTVPSALAEARAFESARQARPVTAPVCPRRVKNSLPDFASQTNSPPNRSPAATSSPSGLNAADRHPVGRLAEGVDWLAVGNGEHLHHSAGTAEDDLRSVGGKVRGQDGVGLVADRERSLPGAGVEPDHRARLPADPAAGEQHLAVAGELQNVDFALGERQRAEQLAAQVEEEHLPAAGDGDLRTGSDGPQGP